MRKRSRAAALVALDSDGTVLDSMRTKHEEAFLPAFAAHFAPREAVAAAEVWRFVNLESKSRGINRYRALAQSLRLLKTHPLVSRVERRWTDIAVRLEAWLACEPCPSISSLSLAIAGRGADAAALFAVLEWSRAVDAAVASLHAPRPFPGALAALPLLSRPAELFVLSGASTATVIAEWRQAGILEYVVAIDGQDRGPKSVCLAARAAARGPSRPVLVVGDAPGDLEAARCAGAAFFPIIPGREDECWDILASSGISRFLAGERSPGQGLLADFLAALPVSPHWGRT
jgi:phosphoglycolate phosphatase-like HAD superfamily hydrolase